MDATFIITVFVVLDSMRQTFLGPQKDKPQMTPAEVLTVAVVTARYVQNHLERAVGVMQETGYIPRSRCLSMSRFNRQLHRYSDFLGFCLQALMEVAREGEAFMLESMPTPVCKRKRARRCRKVRGRGYCGYCAAQGEKFFGWRLPLLCTPAGIPVSFTLLPAAFHDWTPLYELTVEWPTGAVLYGDKADKSGPDEAWFAAEGIRLIPVRKKNMRPHALLDDYFLHRYRHGIETVHSQRERMGLARLRARTNAGFELKVHASLAALYHTQFLVN